MQNANQRTPEQQKNLYVKRKKSKAMIRNMLLIVKKAVRLMNDVDFYWEWPHLCQGWQIPEMLAIRDFLERHGRCWKGARVDGCRYGMMDVDQGQLVRKMWRVMTTSEDYVNMFGRKVCMGDHEHTPIEGKQTSTTSYYPRRWCVSMARF